MSTTPGEIALTRTGASSAASGGTSRSIAPLTAASADRFGRPERALAAEIIVIDRSPERPGPRPEVGAELAVERGPADGAPGQLASGPRPTAPELNERTRWSKDPTRRRVA